MRISSAMLLITPVAFWGKLGGVVVVVTMATGVQAQSQAQAHVQAHVQAHDQAHDQGISYESLPDRPVFPGVWDKYIKAPVDKARIGPVKVWRSRGNVIHVTVADEDWDGNRNDDDYDKKKEGKGRQLVSVGQGGEVTWDFGENIAGRVCFDVVDYYHHDHHDHHRRHRHHGKGKGKGKKGRRGKGNDDDDDQGDDYYYYDDDDDDDVDYLREKNEKEKGRGKVRISLGYSESSWFAGREPDSTGDRIERDLPLLLDVERKGKTCVGKEFVRGGFRYLTLVVLPEHHHHHHHREEEKEKDESLLGLGQKVLGGMEEKKNEEGRKKEKPWVTIGNIWVNCTAFPSQKNGRAYSGYFYSSSELLNRIWYAGAWTLQLSTIDPKEGGALIDYNRAVDGNKSPTGSWYSNFTISNGTAVTTDGAKRDRMVWPGDMYIAIPGIAMSTYDLVAVRNALDVLYDFQYRDGSLPYAGPPMGYHGEFSDTYHLHTLLGTYFYVLYSGDLKWLRGKRWQQYLKALAVSVSKVDEYDLLHVSSTADWLRPGMTGHNGEATAILHAVLNKSLILASWLGHSSSSSSELISSWRSLKSRLAHGLARLYCPRRGLYSDNIGVRSCSGLDSCLPQDGNSWALISGIDLSPSGWPFKHPKSHKRLRDPLPSGPPTAQNISENLRSRWTKFGAPAVEFPNVISPFASGFELLAHHAAGNLNHAVELVLLEWGYLLDGPGFTNSTLAEGFRIDGHVQYPAYWSSARNSHAHGWSSGPTQLLVSGVLGIEIVGLGGVEWRITPELTEWLGWARGGFTTVRGKFEVWIWRTTQKITGGTAGEKDKDKKKGVVVEVRTPEGTSGSVGIGVKSERVEQVEGGGARLFYKMDGDGEGLRALDLSQKKKVSGTKDEDAEDWYKNIVVELGDGSELVFDDEWKEPVMQEREPGVVDWDVMEKYFKTKPPAGWTVDSLRNKVNN